MNKKGQVLVVFVLLLPLIVLFLGLVIDIGNSLVTRKKYENTVKDIILYNYKEEKVEEIEEPIVTGENVVDSSEPDLNDSSETNPDDTSLEHEEEPEVPAKEVDLAKVKKDIENSIEDAEEVSLNAKDNILIVTVKTHYKSIFGNLFDIGLNSINIEVKYNIETKKIVRE